jgi:hypothetical protein
MPRAVQFAKDQVMRLAVLLLCAAASVAVAQEAPPPDPSTAGQPEAHPGLADLNQTVNGLEDAPEAATPDQTTSDQAPPPATDEPATTTIPPDAEMPSQDEGPARSAADQPPAEPSQDSPAPEGEPAAPAEAAADAAQPPEAHPPVLPPYLRHPGAELEPAQEAQLTRAVARGRQLIALARAGLVATRDMLAHISDPDGAGITGWVAEPQGNAMLVTFYSGATADERKAVYRVSVLGPRAVSRQTFLDPAARPALTPAQARLAAARAATNGLDHRPCAGSDFNVLVVPPENADGPIDVYQMSPAVTRGHFPLGGHFRSTVNADGTIAEVRSFMPCADIVPPATAAGTPPEAVPVTGGDDVLPDEIHVFLALWTGHPLLVASGGRTWRVTGESIAEAQ